MFVDHLDHAHILVSDRRYSSAWYGRVLGLRPDPRFDAWAREPGGPLVLCTYDGTTVLSLFTRAEVDQPQDGTLAFRMTGENFAALLDRLPDLQLQSTSGSTLSRANLIDHKLSFSIYFLDPDRNRIEVTTYDRNALAR